MPTIDVPDNGEEPEAAPARPPGALCLGSLVRLDYKAFSRALRALLARVCQSADLLEVPDDL